MTKTKTKTKVTKHKKKDIQKEEDKELEVIDKTNYRQFMILLYEDTTSYDYNEVIDKLTSYSKWAYIKHVPEDNEKKEHIHFILILDNKTSISAISKRFGMPKQFIQNIKDLRQACRYLVHLGWDDKIQYDLDSVEVSTNFRKDFNKCFDDLETDDIIINKILFKINDLLPNYNSPIDLKLDLVKYVSIENYGTLFKKYYNIFNEYISSKFDNRINYVNARTILERK